MDTLRFLDILGFLVGLVYLYLEYRASIWLWLASVVMPAVDMVLYYRAGLYADFGMAIYYCLAALYGYVKWRPAQEKPTPCPSRGEGGSVTSAASGLNRLPSPREGQGGGSSGVGSNGVGSSGVGHFPSRLVFPTLLVFLSLWLLIWWFLATQTNSSVPVTDAFTTALSIVALWALAHKYAEQWLLWFVVDAVCCILYVYKGIPFKAAIYAIYTVVAIAGYRRWLRMIPATAKAHKM